MSTVRKYIVIQIVLCLLTLFLLLTVTKKNLQYIVFFFLISLILFIWATDRPIRIISQYLKDNYLTLYKKRTTFRKYYGKNLVAVDIWGLKKSELIEIGNQQIVQRIKDFKAALKTMLLTMLIILIVLVIKSYS